MIVENEMLNVFLKALELIPVACAWIVFMVNVIGLRSFSKMASFDFAITVAIGSLLAAAITVDSRLKFLSVMIAITVLMFSQYLIAFFRVHSEWFRDLISNDALVLFKDGDFCTENMRAARVTKSDVLGKLREANAVRLDDVYAVILEVTGDISVLHKTDADETGGVDDEIWNLET